MSTREGWTSEPDGRGTIRLVWSCLFTIFICLWSSLHLNIPEPKEDALKILARKLKWVVLAAVATEYVVVFALGQWLLARKFQNSMKNVSSQEWSSIQGFYADMGGIRLEWEDDPAISDSPRREILTSRGLIWLVSRDLLPPKVPLSARQITS